MKRAFATVMLGLILTVVISSCGNRKHHKPCESYGNKSANVENVNPEQLPS